MPNKYLSLSFRTINGFQSEDEAAIASGLSGIVVGSISAGYESFKVSVQDLGLIKCAKRIRCLLVVLGLHMRMMPRAAHCACG